jgi:ABC-type sulfate/molybdate transport systems ATPase subunit
VLKADVEVERREFTVRAAIEVAQGERLALFGPSGAGKTTLLESIAGLVRPTSGTVELAGRILTRTSKPRVAVPPWQRGVGLLRQDPGLFPHLSVAGNLGYARTAAAHRSELISVGDALGIGELLSAMPARLSGGQQHRVALGRLLLAHCDALLLDEPYSGLDATARRTLTALVVRLVTERSVPAVLVAHELADAQAFATRMAVIDRGAVLQVGDPAEIVLRPASMRVAELVGYLGFAAVTGQEEARPGLVAGVHPDRVVAGAAPDDGLVVAGTIAAVRPSGAGWETDFQLPGSVVTCRLTARPGPIGSQFAVTALDPPLFGPDGAAVNSVAAGIRTEGGHDDAAAKAG